MTDWTNVNQSTLAGSGGVVAGALGANITAASSVAISSLAHFVGGSGAINTITGGGSRVQELYLIPLVGSTWTLGSAGNVVPWSAAPQADRPIHLIWDGSTSWREQAPAANVSNLPTQVANAVLAGPPSGQAAAPGFRALVAADVPSLDASKIATGLLPLSRGGSGADLSSSGGANNVVKQLTVGGALSVATLAAADIPSLDASKVSTGQLALARGGTASDFSATGGANKIVKQTALGGALTVAALGAGDVPDAALTSNVPLKNAANTFSGGDQTISAGSLVLSSSTGVVKERNRATPLGESIAFTPTWSANGGGSVSGGTVAVARYTLVGKKMTLWAQLSNFSVSGAVTSVSLLIPGSFTSNAQCTVACPYSDNGTYGIGFAQAASGGAVVNVFKSFAAPAWAASTTNSIVAFSLNIDLQ